MKTPEELSNDELLFMILRSNTSPYVEEMSKRFTDLLDKVKDLEYKIEHLEYGGENI